MNRWNLLTWISVVVLFFGSIVIFGFFLRDLKGIIREIEKR